MAKSSGTTKSVGSGTVASSRTTTVTYSDKWKEKASLFGGTYHTYQNDKVDVMVSKQENQYRVQAMELMSITPKGEQMKSEVKYFSTEQQAKSFADSFIKSAEAKPIIPKEKKFPKFVIKKNGNLKGGL